jgi:hypothetical protein
VVQSNSWIQQNRPPEKSTSDRTCTHGTKTIDWRIRRWKSLNGRRKWHNLIYARTLKAMNISLKFLQQTDCSFHGIVPRSAKYPLGKIELDVCFGDQHNF